MNCRVFIFLLFAPLFCLAQYEFNNRGADIYIQKGALIHVQGNFINGNGTSVNGLVRNDGIIEVKGNFENASDAGFRTFNDTTSKERAVKFVGNGLQSIFGSLNTKGTASVYNLIIDKSNSNSSVELQTPVQVEGSVVFGSGITTSTYNPSSAYTANNMKGFIKTYYGSTEHTLSISNGSTDAIAGYPPLVINGNPATGYILTSGTRGSADGGLQRKITEQSSYVFPLGTETNGFNGVRLNFDKLPVGGGNVRGKFNDGSDNPNGYVGIIAQECHGCTPSYPVPDNLGYNRYFTANPCNGNAEQWLIFENAINSHGYWSFEAVEPDTAYTYTIETFPNSFIHEGNINDPMRTLRHSGAYDLNPTNIVWNDEIEVVNDLNNLLEYSRNTGNCYSDAGIPGGEYTSFGHFALGGSHSSNALPVELLYLIAEAQQASILVKWATVLEINNRGFEVHRSVDGVTWTNIGWVDGNNNSTTQINYSFTDANATAGVRYYYRLKQIDYDGQFEYTDIVTAIIVGETQVVADFFPNPADDNTRITVTAISDISMNIDIYNVIGQKEISRTYQLTKGVNQVHLDIGILPAGTHTVIIQAGKTFAKKLVVAR